MRYNKMTRTAERNLARTVGPFIGRETEAREQRIEALRKAALRASWLDLRQPIARKLRTEKFAAYNKALRSHLKLDHLLGEPGDDWDLDQVHEKLHGRRS